MLDELKQSTKLIQKVINDIENSQTKIPEIIVLCGSTRFHKIFDQMNYQFTMQGKIVLTIGTVTSSDSDLDVSAAEKEMLDELHMRKIDLADTVYVINHNEYIGDSTRSEIEYAKKLNKQIRYFYDEMMQAKADNDLAEWQEQDSYARDYYGGDL